MINRDSRGHPYSTVRGEILGFVEDELLRKHLPRMFSLISERKLGDRRRLVPGHVSSGGGVWSSTVQSSPGPCARATPFNRGAPGVVHVTTPGNPRPSPRVRLHERFDPRVQSTD